MTAQTRAQILNWRNTVKILIESRDILPQDRKRVTLHNKCIKIAQKEIEELENL